MSAHTKHSTTNTYPSFQDKFIEIEHPGAHFNCFWVYNDTYTVHVSIQILSTDHKHRWITIIRNIFNNTIQYEQRELVHSTTNTICCQAECCRLLSTFLLLYLVKMAGAAVALCMVPHHEARLELCLRGWRRRKNQELNCQVCSLCDHDITLT